jgi:hypothetical protein
LRARRKKGFLWRRNLRLASFSAPPERSESRRTFRKMAARPPEFEDFMSPIANENDEALALRVFVAVVAGILVAGIAVGWLFGLAGIGVLAMIATALMLLLTVVVTRG